MKKPLSKYAQRKARIAAKPKPIFENFIVGGDREEAKIATKLVDAKCDVHESAMLDIEPPAVEKIAVAVKEIIAENERIMEQPVQTDFDRDGIVCSYDYKKPAGFEALLSQSKRISDTGIDLSLMEMYGALGLTLDQIGKMHGVSSFTISKWRNAFPEVKEALERGKVSSDHEVVKAGFQRATGYKFTETSVETKPVFDKSGMPIFDELGVQRVLRTVKTTVKEVPPDTEAIKFWTINRMREFWKMTSKTEGEVKAQIIVKELRDLTDEELRKIASEAKN